MSATHTKVALVTGGSRGIGRAVVLRLARDGYDVAFCYASDHEAAETLQAETRRHGGRIWATQADVTNPEAVRALITAAEAALGPLDTVVNNAGVTHDNPLLLMREEQWRRVLDVNLDGTYNVCRATVFSMMKRKAGCIVNISSAAGVHGHATQSNYSAAKAGVIGFTRALAKELGPYGIRANVVAPGFVETDMTAALTGAARDAALDSVPLRRFGRPEEVADMVSYVAGAQYVTGAVLQIDGGVVI